MSPSPVLFVARLLLLLLCARCVVSYNLFWVYFDQSCTQPWAFGATDAVIQVSCCSLTAHYQAGPSIAAISHSASPSLTCVVCSVLCYAALSTGTVCVRLLDSLQCAARVLLRGLACRCERSHQWVDLGELAAAAERHIRPLPLRSVEGRRYDFSASHSTAQSTSTSSLSSIAHHRLLTAVSCPRLCVWSGCSAVSTNYKILEFDATTASNNFTCVKGTNYTQGDSATHSAWFTLVTDTVPGAGAGGGGGVPVGPQTQEGWSMETKMMVVWAVLAVVVAVAVGGYCFYQRSRRSAAQQQQGGAAPLLFPGSGQSVGGDPQQYAAMP